MVDANIYFSNGEASKLQGRVAPVADIVTPGSITSSEAEAFLTPHSNRRTRRRDEHMKRWGKAPAKKERKKASKVLSYPGSSIPAPMLGSGCPSTPLLLRSVIDPQVMLGDGTKNPLILTTTTADDLTHQNSAGA
jgi:hypothetical protein